MKDLLFAQGSLQNALKRIGQYKSNLFCMGEDPITKSGVIISNGEIVSSRILDIKLKRDYNKETKQFEDKVVKLVNNTRVCPECRTVFPLKDLECPNCHEWYEEEKWNFKEN